MSAGRGCIYGKYKGTLLLAVAQGGNNKTILITFALVEGETKEGWMFFLKNLRRHVTQGRSICMVSNIHESIKHSMTQGMVDKKLVYLLSPWNRQLQGGKTNGNFQGWPTRGMVWLWKISSFTFSLCSCHSRVFFISPWLHNPYSNCVKKRECYSIYNTTFKEVHDKSYWPPYDGPVLCHNPNMWRLKKGRSNNTRIRTEMDGEW